MKDQQRLNKMFIFTASNSVGSGSTTPDTHRGLILSGPTGQLGDLPRSFSQGDSVRKGSHIQGCLARRVPLVPVQMTDATLQRIYMHII